MGCCISRHLYIFIREAILMNNFSKLIGLNGNKGGNEKYRSEYPNPTYEHILEALELIVGDKSPKKNLLQLINEGSDLCNDAAGKRFFTFEKFILAPLFLRRV